MEDEKKKKRNKKKKNKHNNKAVEDVVGSEEAPSVKKDRSSNGETKENGETQNAREPQANYQVNNAPEPALATSPRQERMLQNEASTEETKEILRAQIGSYISKEAALEEAIKHLQEEKKSFLHEEAMLKETIAQIRDDNESHLRKQANTEGTLKELEAKSVLYRSKEAALDETIKNLRQENKAFLHKQATLEETIAQLRDENELHLHKEALLEETIRQLREENNSYFHKEVKFEASILELQKVNAELTQKEVQNHSHWIRRLASLEEKLRSLERENESWMVKENASKETINSQSDEIRALRVHVAELEESKSILLGENRHLVSNVSSLQIQLQKLESVASSADAQDGLAKEASESEDWKLQIEAAYSLIDKLIAENAELVEKVSELCIKVDQQNMAYRLSSATENGPSPAMTVDTRNTGPLPLPSKDVSVAVQKMDSMEDIPINDEVLDGNNKNSESIAASTNPFDSESGPPPAEIDGATDPESQGVERDDGVPLSDAPLIGAPLRFVSFVAKYVSGADLVENVEENSLMARY